MKTSLDHLPEGKRAELSRVLEVLFREFEDVTKRKSGTRLQGRILKVILFGSYARGNWVDDPVGGYKSDYDLLIVVNHDDFADVTDYWMGAEAHLEQLSVLPEHGRRGHGRALVDSAKREARTRGYGRLTLRTFAEIPWNAPFYAGCGFVETRPATVHERELQRAEEQRGLERLGRRVQMTVELV